MIKRRFLFFVCLLIFVAVILAPAQSKDNNPKREKSLHVAIPFPFDGNLDPAERNYIALQPFFRAIYSTLYKLDAQLRPRPFLAASYEQRAKTFILDIKKEALFSDGTGITATDAIAAIEMSMSNSRYPTPLCNVIQGGEEFFQGKSKHCSGIKMTGPKRLEIQLREKNIQFAHYLTSSLMSIIPAHRNQKQKVATFTGAFRVVDIRFQEKETLVTLKPNPHYLGNKSKITILYFHFYKTPADFEHAIYKGDPELFLYIEHFKIPYSGYKYNYFKIPIHGAFYLQLNPLKGPFKDKQLRKFFKEFILSLDLGHRKGWELTTPTKLVLPYGLTGYSVFNQMVPRDFRKLIPAQKVKLVALNTTSKIKEELFIFLKAKLAKYNVELELQWESREKVIPRIRSGDFDIISYNYMVDVPLSSYFYETIFTPGHGMNNLGYQVPDATHILDNYYQESDEFVRLRILSHLEELAQEESFLIPVITPLSILGYKRNVSNVKIDKFLNVNFEDIDVY